MELLCAVLEFTNELVQQEVFQATALPSFTPPPAPPTPPPTNPLTRIKLLTCAAPCQKLVPLPIPLPTTLLPPILVEGSSDEVEEVKD